MDEGRMAVKTLAVTCRKASGSETIEEGQVFRHGEQCDAGWGWEQEEVK